MKKFTMLFTAAALTAGLTACGGTSGGQTADSGSSSGSINFTMAMVDNNSSNYYEGAMKIAECVEQATDGKITISVQAGGTLGGESDTLDMAIQGDLIQEKANAQGIHVIGYMESGFRDVFSTRPIESMADFKGLKIRVMQNDGQLAAFTAFGANPIALSSSEQFTALQQGTIDACENAVSNCWINKYYEADVNSVINTKQCFVYIPLCMSDNAWNQIPDDLKDTFVNAVWEGCEAQWQYLDEANEEATQNLEDAGVTFYDIDTDELKDAYESAKTTTYDADWEAAVEAAKTAVQ